MFAADCETCGDQVSAWDLEELTSSLVAHRERCPEARFSASPTAPTPRAPRRR